MELRGAIKKTNEIMADSFAVLCLPLISVGLFFRGIDGLAHSIWPSKGLRFVPALALLVCMPVAALAETVVAAMYLQWRRSGTTISAEWRKVASYPGLAGQIARLVAMTLLWLVVAAVLAGVVVGIIVGVVAGFEHKRIAPGSHLPSGIFLPAVWVVYAFLAARYSFVLPITALRESGSGGNWKAAVVRAKRHLGTLRLVTAVEYLGVTSVSRFAVLMTAGVGAWHVRSIAWVAAGSVVAAVLTTYFEVLKTELAVQVEAEFGG